MTANHVEHGIATFPGSPSRQFRYMSGAEPNATLRVGLMVRPETARVSFCPTQAPSSRKPGLFFESRPRRVAVERADMSTTRTHFTFRVDTWSPDGESIVEPALAHFADYRLIRISATIVGCAGYTR